MPLIKESKRIVIDGWSARMAESMSGQKGLAYRVNIRFYGRLVGEAYNEGNGGADRFYFNDPDAGVAWERAVKRHVKKGFEPDALFLDLLLGD